MSNTCCDQPDVCSLLGAAALDPQEAKERRQQLSKLRALESYYEAKCRRAKKIKSKKYRKVQKKVRVPHAGLQARQPTGL